MTKAFDKLSNFILNQMRMSHIYQPVMLIEILKKNGSASTNEIAKALLSHDISQVEYYEHIISEEQQLKAELNSLKRNKNRLDAIEKSYSLMLGRLLTAPLRAISALFAKRRG